MKPLVIVSIVALCLAAVATPPKGKAGSKKSPGPHYQAYATFMGKPGEFRGPVGSQNRIPVLTFKLNSGKKSHSTMSLTIQSLGAQDFENARNTHEVLRQVRIEVMGRNIEGLMKVAQTISLANVTVGSVKIRFSGGKEVDDLTLTYEKEVIVAGQ